MQVVHARFQKYSPGQVSHHFYPLSSKKHSKQRKASWTAEQRCFWLSSFPYRASHQALLPVPERPGNDRVTFTQVRVERMHSAGEHISRGTTWGSCCTQQQFSGFLWSQTIMRIQREQPSLKNAPFAHPKGHPGPGLRTWLRGLTLHHSLAPYPEASHQTISDPGGLIFKVENGWVRSSISPICCKNHMTQDGCESTWYPAKA